MSVAISIIISVLALLATFWQAHLQRIHNEKSVKPLGQIDLGDFPQKLSVYLYNNGLGPLIVDQLTFLKGGKTYTTIEGCLALPPQSYMHVPVTDSVKRVVLPNAYLMIFEASLEEQESEVALNRVREQLAPIALKVEGRDVYDNKITLERDFHWFSRYIRGGETNDK